MGFQKSSAGLVPTTFLPQNPPNNRSHLCFASIPTRTSESPLVRAFLQQLSHYLGALQIAHVKSPTSGCFDLAFTLVVPPLADPDLGKSRFRSQFQKKGGSGMGIAS